jgi:hypothetical protein
MYMYMQFDVDACAYQNAFKYIIDTTESLFHRLSASITSSLQYTIRSDLDYHSQKGGVDFIIGFSISSTVSS